jgi:hypothetical protein
MLTLLRSCPAFLGAIGLLAAESMAAPIPIDTANANNGLTDIYSASFDGGLSACTESSPSYCSFFGGDPGATRNVLIAPNPTGVVNAVPGGIGPDGIPVAPAPASGSFLELTLNGAQTELTLGTGSAITFGDITISIPSQATTATAEGAGMVLNTGGTATLNAEGQAEFLVSTSPDIAADFSRFSQVVTDCTGPGCPLISADILNLDMVRYRLFIDFEPDFSSFTGAFIGQTANNSLVFATLDSAFIPLPAAGWLLLPAVAAAALRARKRKIA